LWLFFEKHSRRQLQPDETVTALRLLEMQRNAMLMYTSCGWFFDEISGIETVQVIQYAARVIQLVQVVAGEDVEAEFLSLRAAARRHRPEDGDGAQVYRQRLKLGSLDPPKV